MSTQPVQHFSKDGKWNEAKSRHVAFNTGTEQNPNWVWREVEYSWVGRGGKWVLQYDKNKYSGVTLVNGRYFEGAKYRGDMVMYGNSLKELPDPVAGQFRGSQYKFHTSPTDTLQNYANFMAMSVSSQNAEVDVDLNDPNYQSPFTSDKHMQLCRLTKDKKQYIRTVTKPGQEGFNWGVGGFFGTVPTSLYANIFALAFRIPEGKISGTEYTWLWYCGSPNNDNSRGDEWAGLVALGTGELRYMRHSTADGDISVSLPNAVNFGQWQCVSVQQKAGHTGFRLSINPKTPQEDSATNNTTNRITGDAFQDAYIGAGPELNISNNTVDKVDGNSHRGDLDLFRYYVETAYEFDEAKAPRWWEPEQIFKLWARVGDPSGSKIDISKHIIQLPRSQDNDRFIIQMPTKVGHGKWWVSYESNEGESNVLPMRVNTPPLRKTELFCDFKEQAEWERDFLIAHKQWGGTGQIGSDVKLLNGGVVKENIQVFPNYVDTVEGVGGVLRTWANGSFYSGDIRGVNRIGEMIPDRKSEVGACIATRDYLGPGSFRMKIRSSMKTGVCSCCWTFHYEEVYPNDERYESMKSYGNGLTPQGNKDDGYYIVRNNEIDIEWPTALEGSADMEDVDVSLARFNTWQGEQRPEYTDEFSRIIDGVMNDGKWHEVGFDWHVNDPNPPIDPVTNKRRAAKRIDFYCDGILRQSLESHIPDIPGRFWMGVWFPRAPGNRWAGAYANYERDSMDIDWFRWRPFDQSSTPNAGESYANDVWRDWDDSMVDESITDTLPPAVISPKPIIDALIKDVDGSFAPGVMQAAGANHARYIGQNRLEWRQDIASVRGKAGDVFFKLNHGVSVKVEITMVDLQNQSSGIELVTFESGNDVVRVPKLENGETWSHEFTTRANDKTVILRRNAGGGRLFQGITDIKATYL